MSRRDPSQPPPEDKPGYRWTCGHEGIWRWYKKHPTKRERLDKYAAQMRAGETPFFTARTGRGEWGTGIERREAAVRSARTRRGE
jgi:hypothetical protein